MSPGQATIRSGGTLQALLAAACILCGAVPIGCRRTEPIPPYETFLPVSTREVPKTELSYELVRSIVAGVGELRGIAIGPEDAIYVVGSAGLRVLDGDGRELRAWKVPADARAVAVADDGSVWLALLTKVLKFDATGTQVARWGSEGSGPGELRHVTSIAVSDGNVLVADARNLCIHRFAPDGDLINEIGKRDREANFLGLLAPSPYLDFVVDADGKVIVGNPGRRRIETYTLDGELLGHWGKSGFGPEGFCGCCNPTNIALRRDGLIVTSEKGLPRVKVYDRSGKMLAYIPPTVFPPEAAGMDLAVDSKDRIYVAEPVKDRIMVFAKKTEQE